MFIQKKLKLITSKWNKTLSVLLCISLICGLVTVNVFANTQGHGNSVAGAQADGVISEGEYSWTTGLYDRNSEVANEFHVFTPHTDTIGDGLWAQYWLDYDEDYIYVGYKERGDYKTTAWVDINPRIGMGNTTGQIFIYFEFVRDDSKQSAYDASCAGRVYVTDGSGNYTTELSDYVVDAKGFYYDDGMRNQNTVEIKLNRDALTTYAGAAFDSIGFRGLVQSGGSEALYYDGNSSVKPIWFHEDKGYKKIELPTGESNSRIDGVIDSEEYYWMSAKYDRNIDVDSEYKVIQKHTDTEQLTTQYFVDFDDDYIYLGYTDRVRGFDTDASIDLAPILTDGKAKGQIHLDITANQNGHSVTGEIYEQNGTKSDIKDYIVDSASTGYDDGFRYNNCIEICLDRKKISQYAGAEFDKIGILGVTRNYGGIGVYGNESVSDDLRPECEYDGIGYHIVTIAYNVWIRFNQTHHIKNDGAGNITYGFHDWSKSEVISPKTEFNDGEIVYTCSVCGAIDSDVIPATGHYLLRVEAKDPNCTETGHKQYKACEYCDYTYKYEALPVNNEHVYDDDADMECNLCTYNRGGEGSGGSSDSGNTDDSGNTGNSGSSGDNGNGEAMTNPNTGDSSEGIVAVFGATIALLLGLCIVFMMKKKECETIGREE